MNDDHDIAAFNAWQSENWQRKGGHPLLGEQDHDMMFSDPIELSGNLGWINVELDYALEPLRPRTLVDPESGGVIPMELRIEGTTVDETKFPELLDHLVSRIYAEHYGD